MMLVRLLQEYIIILFIYDKRVKICRYIYIPDLSEPAWQLGFKNKKLAFSDSKNKKSYQLLIAFSVLSEITFKGIFVMAKQTITVEFDPTKEKLIHHPQVVTTYKEPYIPFVMVGQLGRTKVRGTPMDAIALLLELNATEQWFMKYITTHNDANNLVNLTNIKFTQAESLKINRAYPSLRKKDIIRRKENRIYMINPMFLLPRENREHLLEIYNLL